MECFGTIDFDNNSRLIILSAIIISGLHCIHVYTYIQTQYLEGKARYAATIKKEKNQLM